MLLDSHGNPVRSNALIIRHTEIGQFRNCPRYWYMTSHNGMNLESRKRDKKLIFGIAWHEGIERKTRDKVSVVEGFNESLDAQVAEMEADLGQGIYDVDIQAEIKEMRDLGEKLGTAYDAWTDGTAEGLWAEPAANPLDSELEVIDVEKRLLVRIPGTYTWLASKLDAIVKYRGAIWTMEHKSRAKSTRIDNPGNTTRDIQMGLQLLALKLAGYTENGQVLGGAIYNLARKQVPSNRVKNPIFARHLVHFTEDQLQILENDLKYIHAADIRAAKLRPQNTLRRYNPGIGANSFCDWGCAGKEVCEALNRGEDVGYLLNRKFKVRAANVMEMLSEEMEE